MTEVELTLLEEPPRHVCGPRSFVLFQPDVGRVEIGNPLPDDEIWNHVGGGDIRFTVTEEPNGMITGGGGRPWDREDLDISYSEPGTGTGPDDRAYVIISQVPLHYAKVAVDQDDSRFTQSPINRTVVIPLDNQGSRHFTVVGITAAGEEAPVFQSG